MYYVNKISNWDIRIDFQTDKPCELYVDTFPTTPKDCIRVLWAVEPNEISGLRDTVIQRHNEFDLILTWHKEVLDSCTNAKLFPLGTSWILDFDFSQEKKYSITSIVGGKKLTQNQLIRQELPKVVSEIVSIQLELFNSLNNPYQGQPSIERVMQDRDKKNELFYSQFHIVIENVSHPNFFTEKLIDCFQTKTVPIYLGCTNISDFFDIRGMILVDNLENIVTKCNSITQKTYQEMLPYIEQNYQRSVKYAKFRETLRDEVINYVKNH
jgi:hypothetical protein